MCRKRRMRERTRCEAGFLSEIAMGIGTPADSCLSSDIRLPEASGWVVARAYRERFPNQPVLYAEQMQPVPGRIIISGPYSLSQVVSILGTRAA
jgi:hypothetical protein